MQRHAGKQLLWLGGISLVVNLMPVFAQDPPATTYQPGYWQPLARVNPDTPITVTLVNQTKSPLKYNFLDDRVDSELLAGESKQIKAVSLPVNIAIYDPSPAASSGNTAGLKYQVAVTKNDIQVNITPVESSGSRVVNISKTGAIYVY